MSDVAAIEKICPQCGRTYGAESVFCAADGSSLRPLSGSADLVGTVIADRYLVLDKLGEGGMGRVYRARHVRLPQEVAIKVLSAKLVNDPDSIARFNREAANASSISSEHVARVFDFGETGDGLVYLAMEFVPGRTLRGVLEADGPLQPHRAASLVWQIAEGLDAAHRRGIVHRDLKPENVIVYVDTDGSERLKVVDFGIAKALTDGGTGRMTRTGLVIGTPEYMSPEQITGDAVDGRSDVYALALVTCVLLTGQQAFDARTPEAAMTAKLLRDPKPLRELLPSVDWPAPLQAVVSQGLARDPADRFSTAGEFAGALADAVDGWLAPDEARTGAMARPTVPGRRPYATPARPTTALGAGTSQVARPLAPTGFSGQAGPSDTLVRGSVEMAPTEPQRAVGAPGTGAAGTGAAGTGAAPATPAESTAPHAAAAAAAAAGVPGLADTGVVSSPSGRGAPPRAHDAAAAPPGGNRSDAAGAIPTRPGPSRGLVIGGAVAGVAALALVAVYALKPPPAPTVVDSIGASSAAPSATQAPPEAPVAPPAVDSPAPPPDRAPAGAPAGAAAAVPNALDAAGATRELDALNEALHPDRATTESARRSLRALQALLPRLPTAADSVRADVLRFQAYVLTDQTPRGCALLATLRGRTLTENQRALVRLWGQELCSGG